MSTLMPSFDLPPSIKALQSGWQTTFQSAATVSALLAAVEGQLFVFVEALEAPTEGASNGGIGPPKLDLSSRGGQALLCFTFLTFLLSIGATVSSLILSDQVAELPIRGYGAKDMIDQNAEIKGTGIQIMVAYGLDSSLGWFMWHWLSMLILGYLSLLVQIVIYVSLTQTRLVNIFVGVAGIWVLLPLIVFFLPSRRRSIRHGPHQPHPTPIPRHGPTKFSERRDLKEEGDILSDEEMEVEEMVSYIRAYGHGFLVPLGKHMTLDEENADAGEPSEPGSTSDTNSQTQSASQAPTDLDADMQDLDADVQDLDASTQDLDASVQDLDASVQDLDASVQDLDASVQDLDADIPNEDSEADQSVVDDERVDQGL